MLDFVREDETTIWFDHGPSGRNVPYRYSSIKPWHVAATFAAVACKHVRESLVVFITQDESVGERMLAIPESNWADRSKARDPVHDDLFDYVLKLPNGYVLLPATRYGIEEGFETLWLSEHAWFGRVVPDREFPKRL